MKRKWFPERGVFRRFLLTYLVIMFSFIVAVGIISSIMINSITEYDRNKQYQAAINSNEMLNQQIANIRNLCTQIENDTGALYTSFLKGSKNLINVNDGEFRLIKKKIYENINVFVALNSVVEDIYLFSEEDNSVIFSRGSVDMDVMYGDLLRFGDMSLEEFRKTYLTGKKFSEFTPMIEVYNADENTESILFIESYPLDAFSKPTGYIVISIEVKELLNILGYTDEDKEKQVCLYGPDGKLLYSSFKTNGEIEIDKEGICTIEGEKYIAYSSENDEGLNFVSAGLYDSAIKKTISMRVFTVSILFCAILVGLMLSVYFAKFNTKPIKKLIDKLENVKPAGYEIGDEYTYIAKSIDSIINDAIVIEKDFERERPVLINDFVNSLLIGKYITYSEIERIAHKLRVDVSGKKFAVMLLEIMGGDDGADNNREKLRYIQKSVSEEYRHRFNCLTYMNGMDSVYIIFRFENDDETNHIESIESVTYTIGETLYEKLHVRLKCALGRFYDDLSDIPYSYEGAYKLLEKGTRIEYRNIVWCVQSDGVLSWYYYPNEIEQRLEFAFRNRAIEEIEHILSLVKKENYTNRVLDSSTIKLLYMHMKITVHNIMRQYCSELDEKQMWNVVNGLDDSSEMETFFVGVAKLYRELVNNSQSKSIKQEILDYVNKAALDIDFDRQTFAKHFYISPDYVSKFFKENTGYGFTKYSTKVRIDKACELLADDNYNIERISGAVGYSSALSFRRAFKNYTGISPSDYRRRLIEGK